MNNTYYIYFNDGRSTRSTIQCHLYESVKTPRGVCEVIGQTCAGEGDISSNLTHAIKEMNEQDAISQCEGSGGGPLGPPHGGDKGTLWKTNC